MNAINVEQPMSVIQALNHPRFIFTRTGSGVFRDRIVIYHRANNRGDIRSVASAPIAVIQPLLDLRDAYMRAKAELESLSRSAPRSGSPDETVFRAEMEFARNQQKRARAAYMHACRTFNQSNQ